MTNSDLGNTPRIAIIGAGISGMTMGIKLKKAGIDSFDIFDAEGGLGGTWRVNTYPGAAVDIHSLMYQFGFRTQNWLRTHATQAENLEYLENIADEFELKSHFRFSTPIDEARWDDRQHVYRLTTGQGEVLEYDVVVSGVGLLSNPNKPTWPGIETFEGPVIHPAQWDHSVDLTGKRVAVVGVGSSSVQIVPAIAPIAEKVTVFQREPGWILPKGDRPFTDAERTHNSKPRNITLQRTKLIAKKEFLNLTMKASHTVGSKRNLQGESMARTYIDTVFKDRPDLRAAVTPSYPFEGKRVIFSSDYFPALLEPNVELVPQAVSSVTPKGIVDVNGIEHEVDVIITATGYTATSFLETVDVYGVKGTRLKEVWENGAFAYVGMTVPKFPNFYLLFGPNTNGAGAVSLHWKAEQQANWVVRDVKRMIRRGVTAIDTRKLPTVVFNRWLQWRLRKTAWAQSNNYFKDPKTGKITTQFHGSITLQYVLLRIGRPIGTFTRKLKGR